MHRQVGDLVLDQDGIALRGLLIRHLILPGGLAGTAEIARFLAQEISQNTYINVMDQYRPCYRAHELPPLNRSITPAEYEAAIETARRSGLHRFDQRRPRSLRLLW
jgi:putative pyruvate formate lyase activating enzyme